METGDDARLSDKVATDYRLTWLRHRRLTADTVLPTAGPLWLTVLNGGVELQTAAGVVGLDPGDAAWLDGRNSYRITTIDGADVTVGDLRAGSSRRLPSPLTVREFASRHVGVASLTQTCPLDGSCQVATFAQGYGNLLGAAMVDSWLADEGLDAATDHGDPAIAQVIAAITTDPALPWTAASMAAVAHLSRSKLGERFRKELGRGPVQMLREIRMGEARRLLTEPSRTVDYVASRVSYGSLAAFSRAFAGHHGMAPQVWRSQAQA